MGQSVYIETTIISVLTARPSRDLWLAGQQEITRNWWNLAAPLFDLCTSELVVLEASGGDTHAAAKRLKAMENLPLLGITPQAIELSERLLAEMALPAVANRDAQHVGIAAVNGVDFLLTWNCRHLANARLRGKIEEVCDNFGVRPPIICTPTELLGEDAPDMPEDKADE